MILKTQSLPPQAAAVVCDKSTERPFTGEYDAHAESGSYLCRQCGLALFRATHKFHSGCGWPSFDAEITGTVQRIPDPDGMRVEIVCARCEAHLGHIFEGERYTDENTRHCVNSVSLDFVHDVEVQDTEEAILAAGCFWGIAHALKKIPGVLKAEVGYTGGTKAYPAYEAVCRGDTGHAEAVRVVYDPQRISYAALLQHFFALHDPTQPQMDRQAQYRGAIFYYDAGQKDTLQQVIQAFENAQQTPVRLFIEPVGIFWPAEAYHQEYYEKKGM